MILVTLEEILLYYTTISKNMKRLFIITMSSNMIKEKHYGNITFC